MRAAYGAAIRNELPYLAPVTKFRVSPARRLPPSATCVRQVSPPRWKSPAPIMPLSLNVSRSRWRRYRSPTAPSLFQSAIEEVRASADLARLPLLLLDVPIHSAIERAFIAELASAAKEVLFTCRASDIRTLDNLKMVPRAQENAALPNKAPNKRGGSHKQKLCLYGRQLPGKPRNHLRIKTSPHGIFTGSAPKVYRRLKRCISV